MSKPTDKPEDDAVSNDVADILGFGSEGAEQSWEDSDGDDGLEIDDGQAEEIRHIFLTTLPQYLEPVEQMLHQIFDEAAGANAETRNAVVATLTSLSEAASRIGVDEIYDRLSQMCDQIAGLDDDNEQGSTQAKKNILSALDEVKLIAAGDEVPDVEQSNAAGSHTIVSALSNVSGLDESVLGRLTSAGLLTVDQLLMADPDEVVAVSGLDSEVVATILASLADSTSPSAKTNVVQLAVAPESLRKQLSRNREQQTTSETALAEARAEVQSLRQRLCELRDALAAAKSRQDQLYETLPQLRAKASESVAALKDARAARREFADRHSDTERAVSAREQRILDLRSERKAAIEERQQLDREVAGLVAKVRRILDNAIRG